MEIRNPVIRITDKSNRRSNNIYLTNLGKEIQKILTTTTRGIYMNAIKGFSDQKLKELVNTLNKLINNMK